jgi:hypothetical protein
MKNGHTLWGLFYLGCFTNSFLGVLASSTQQQSLLVSLAGDRQHSVGKFGQGYYQV